MLKCSQKYFTQSTPGCFFKSKNKNFDQINAQGDEIDLIDIIQKLQLTLFSLKQQSQKVLKYSNKQILVKERQINELKIDLQKQIEKNIQLSNTLNDKLKNTSKQSNNNKQLLDEVSYQLNQILKIHESQIGQKSKSRLKKLKYLVQERICKEVCKDIDSLKGTNYKQFSNLSTNISQNKKVSSIVNDQFNQKQSLEKSVNQKSHYLKFQQENQDFNKKSISNFKQSYDDWLCLQSKNSEGSFKTNQVQKFASQLIVESQQYSNIEKYDKHNKQNQFNQQFQMHLDYEEVKPFTSNKLHNFFSPLSSNLIKKKVQMPKNTKQIYLNNFRISNIQIISILPQKSPNQLNRDILDKSFQKQLSFLEEKNIEQKKVQNINDT